MSRILTICPSLRGKGGIVNVVKTLSSYYEPFYYVETTALSNKLLNTFTLLKALVKYIYFLACKDIELVHIHSASNMSFKRKALFARIAKVFHVKVIMHIHGGSFKDYYNNNRHFVENILKRNVDAVIALSSSWEDFFRYTIGCRHVYVLNNPIPKPHDVTKSSSPKVRFLFLGKICKEKGCYDLVDALALSKEMIDNTCFHLAGIGEIDEMNDYINQKGLSGIIKCVGWVEGSRKQQEYTSADYFILPSYIEGLPVSVLEALSYKLPVIATPVGGIPEIIDDTVGIIVNPGDIHKLRDAIVLFANMPTKEREKMGTQCYEKSTKYFEDSVLEHLGYIYNDILMN